MAKIQPQDLSYGDFNTGAKDHIAPVSAIDKKILNFAIRTKDQPIIKTHGQILNHFGMLPPEFWTRVQNLSEHPDLHPRTRNRLMDAFPVLSSGESHE